MCSRLKFPEDMIALRQVARIERDNLPDYAPRWNVAPPALVPVVSNRAASRSLEWMRWGLIPSWATDQRNLHATFNARAESIDAQPVFRDAWKGGRRCLVIAGGYYEWRKTDKQPFCIALESGQPMALAGLWEESKPGKNGDAGRSCTIITTAAVGDWLVDIHERMPVILEPEIWPAWLGEEPSVNPAALLKPFATSRLKRWPVDKRVSQLSCDDRDVAAPIQLPPLKR